MRAIFFATAVFSFYGLLIIFFVEENLCSVRELSSASRNIKWILIFSRLSRVGASVAELFLFTSHSGTHSGSKLRGAPALSAGAERNS